MDVTYALWKAQNPIEDYLRRKRVEEKLLYLQQGKWQQSIINWLRKS